MEKLKTSITRAVMEIMIMILTGIPMMRTAITMPMVVMTIMIMIITAMIMRTPVIKTSGNSFIRFPKCKLK